ncbi:hypothetical protein DRP04_05590 [Archaeoglobales archaeon]|nr:MAG: hypothetical protein DRP04_05590 [Archaeoglobales archaeon]
MVTEDVKSDVNTVLRMLMHWEKKDLSDFLKSWDLEELVEEVHKHLQYSIDKQTLRDCLVDCLVNMASLEGVLE